MKKIRNFYFLLLLFMSIIVSACKTDPGISNKLTYAATVRLSIGSMPRYLYNMNDVSKFTVILDGIDETGESVNYICTEDEYNYIIKDSEIVIYIKKAGEYTISVNGYNEAKSGEKLIIASGVSEKFYIDNGEEKMIRVPIKYTEIPDVKVMNVTSVSGCDVRELSNHYIITEAFDVEPIRNYVSYLTEKSQSGSWWELWGEDIDKFDINQNITHLFESSEQNYINDTNIKLTFYEDNKTEWANFTPTLMGYGSYSINGILVKSENDIDNIKVENCFETYNLPFEFEDLIKFYDFGKSHLTYGILKACLYEEDKREYADIIDQGLHMKSMYLELNNIKSDSKNFISINDVERFNKNSELNVLNYIRIKTKDDKEYKKFRLVKYNPYFTEPTNLKVIKRYLGPFYYEEVDREAELETIVINLDKVSSIASVDISNETGGHDIEW